MIKVLYLGIQFLVQLLELEKSLFKLHKTSNKGVVERRARDPVPRKPGGERMKQS